MQPRSNSLIFKASLIHALSQNTDLTHYFMNKYHLKSNEDWLSTSVLIDCLYEIEERIGPSTLKRVGSNIAKHAVIPDSHRSFQDFLKYTLNDTYKANHQSLQNGFKINSEDHKLILDLKENPYPLTFNKGLLAGFSLKHNTFSRVTEIDSTNLLIEDII
ncbi:MAG TPA: hypothetical protein VEV44_12480 [Pseudoneobacillus sp.]|nr:hypothetical protein [Pseudoneobacillus sp.]